MQELIKAGSGIYLGPLRLLAYEQYEKLTDKGLSCNLITGEEEILNEDASFQASTIDVLDFKKGYSCAVIDEAQMLTDEFREADHLIAGVGRYDSSAGHDNGIKMFQILFFQNFRHEFLLIEGMGLPVSLRSSLYDQPF